MRSAARKPRPRRTSASQYESLTAREREVMGHVTAGLMNKQIAGLIGLSEITVKIHRGNVMRKMEVRVAGRPRSQGRSARDFPEPKDYGPNLSIIPAGLPHGA